MLLKRSAPFASRLAWSEVGKAVAEHGYGVAHHFIVESLRLEVDASVEKRYVGSEDASVVTIDIATLRHDKAFLSDEAFGFLVPFVAGNPCGAQELQKYEEGEYQHQCYHQLKSEYYVSLVVLLHTI